MHKFIRTFGSEVARRMSALPEVEIAKAIAILEATFERDGRIYVCGNGGSLAMATHWVSDFNKTVFSHALSGHNRRFQAVRLPSTESELTAWANDVGYDMVFAGPLANYLQDNDCLVAISSSGNSPNIVKACEFAQSRHVPIIGLSGFTGGKLNELSDAKILVETDPGAYTIVESVHTAILHLIVQYFQDMFDERLRRGET